MASTVRRRSVVKGILAASTASSGFFVFSRSIADAGTAALGAGPSHKVGEGAAPDWASKPVGKIVRKSAEAMTEEEIARFKRAFAFAVSSGYFDAFNDEHNDHDFQHNHGAEIGPATPFRILVMPPSWGLRLLPWHRAFILEGEAMLRAALRKLNSQQRKDPNEADLLFAPYWNATAGQKLPKWVEDFQPKGGTALVVADLPKGHAGYGKKIGTRYNIKLGRWPGTLPGVTLPTTDNIRDMMGRAEFADFVAGFDTDTRLLPENIAKAQAAVKVLEGKLKGDPALPAIKKVLDAGQLPPRAEVLALFSVLFDVDWRATHVMHQDPAIVQAVNDMFSAVRWSPHAQMHMWVGGIDPKNVDVRGTVSYFNELTVDPAFWMIHSSLDRAWYMWEKAHPGKAPPLEGEDRVFQPMSPKEGKWYGGGRVYTLDDLTAHDKLPFTYAEL